MEKIYLDIAVKGPFDKCWTYSSDIKYGPCLFIGQKVRIIFGNRKDTGYIHRIYKDFSGDKNKIKDILDIINIQNIYTNSIFKIINFINDYYHAPIGYCYSNAITEHERIKKVHFVKDHCSADILTGFETELMNYIKARGPVSISGMAKKFHDEEGLYISLSYLNYSGLIGISFDNGFDEIPDTVNKAIILSDEQQIVYNDIYASLNSGFSTHLIHGITGSGKTFIYLKLARDIIMMGRQVLLLVPEIGLSIQLKNRFQQFIASTAMLHSSLGKGTRKQIINSIRNGTYKLVIGPRSSLFIPFDDLGLIIIDEEHDRSFKQDTVPSYNARDIAVYRAKTENIPIILGSGTPCLESYYNSRHKGKYKFYELLGRYGDSSLPNIILVDLKEEKAQKRSTLLSRPLMEQICRMKEAREQGIIFINRRGFYSAIICLKCGDSIKCLRCSVSMSYHHDTDRLVCHQCGYKRLMVDNCPYCGSERQTHFGFGTEQVEEMIREYMPGLRILRFDSDKVKQKDKDRLLADFMEHNFDLIVGTQMITKGFDFPGVTLVGVIQADENLYIPDFRGAERTFQTISQVSGRSGRRHKKGVVVLQTYMPEHYSIEYSIKGDYQSFAEKELRLRQRLGYPPFKRQCLISATGHKKSKVLELINNIYERIEKHKDDKITVIGPASAFIEKRKYLYTWNILLQGGLKSINKALNSINDIYKANMSIISIDMDPYTF